MDTAQVRRDLQKALALVANKHGVEYKMDLTLVGDGLSAKVLLGESMSEEYAEYLKHAKADDKIGHNSFKRILKGLDDGMLGRAFDLPDGRFIYVGMRTSRPKNPVTMLGRKRGVWTSYKAPEHYVEKMIAIYQRERQKEGVEAFNQQLSSADPELTSGAQF